MAERIGRASYPHLVQELIRALEEFHELAWIL
jgi:hypothetical protein